MEKITLRAKNFPLEWKRRVKGRAAEKGVTMADIIVEALRLYFDSKRSNPLKNTGAKCNHCPNGTLIEDSNSGETYCSFCNHSA